MTTADLISDPRLADLGVEAVARARRVNPTTVVRWIRRGCRSAEGPRVRLAAVRVGGQYRTCEAAVRAFLEQLTPRPDPAEPATRADAAARVAAARRQLAAMRATTATVGRRPAARGGA